MIRRSGLREDPVEHGRDLTLGRREPGHLGVGGVDHEQVDALLAEPGERAQVGDAAVQRQLVHLEVAGVQDGARAGVRTATARASGIEWLTATNSHSNGPNRSICPSRTASVYGVIRCSLSLASTRASVSWEPTSGMSGRRRSR